MMAKKADCNKESNDNSVAVEDDDRGRMDAMFSTMKYSNSYRSYL